MDFTREYPSVDPSVENQLRDIVRRKEKADDLITKELDRLKKKYIDDCNEVYKVRETLDVPDVEKFKQDHPSEVELIRRKVVADLCEMGWTVVPNDRNFHREHSLKISKAGFPSTILIYRGDVNEIPECALKLGKEHNFVINYSGTSLPSGSINLY